MRLPRRTAFFKSYLKQHFSADTKPASPVSATPRNPLQTPNRPSPCLPSAFGNGLLLPAGPFPVKCYPTTFYCPFTGQGPPLKIRPFPCLRVQSPPPIHQTASSRVFQAKSPANPSLFLSFRCANLKNRTLWHVSVGKYMFALHIIAVPNIYDLWNRF